MTNSIRKWLAYGVICFLAILMLSFGIDPTGGGGQDPALRIDETEVSQRAFYNRYEQVRSYYRQQFKENFGLIEAQLNLRQQVMDAYITDTLVNSLSADLGLTASSKDIEKQILNNPYFGGEYSEQAYASFLRATGLTGGELERLTRQELVRKQLETTLKDVQFFSEAELRAAYNEDNTEIKLNYLNIDPAKFEEKVDTSDDDALITHYEARSAQYKRPKRVNFSYLRFEPKNFRDQVEITQEDLEDAFSKKRHEFIVPAKVKLRQIFFSKKEDSPIPFMDTDSKDEAISSEPNKESEALSKAEVALSRLQAGEDFSELAKEISEDKTTKDNGGDLGELLFASLIPELRKAAKELEEGEYSEAIDTPQGTTILYLEKNIPKREQTIEEVRNTLEENIRNSESPLYAAEEAEVVFEKWQESKLALTEFSASNKLDVKTSEGLVSKTNSKNVLTSLISEAIKLDKGQKEILDVGDDSYIVEILDSKDAYIAPLEDVRSEVLASYKKEQSEVLAKEFAESLPKDKPLSQLAKDNQLELLTSEVTKKKDLAQKGLFIVPDIKKEAFTLSKSSPRSSKVFSFENKFVLLELNERKLPDAKGFEEEKESLLESEKKRGGEELLQSLVASLRAESDIWVNTELLVKPGA